MTLCIAWKKGYEVYFASDSRLTDNQKSVLTNDATKIFKVGVEIYGPVRSEEPEIPEPLLHQTTFGLCFTGSYLNGSLLADTIEEVLSNLQGTREYSDFSIANLTDIAFAIYKQVSKQLTEIHRENGLTEVLFGGYCPINSEFKLYKFYPKPLIAGEPLYYEKEEVSINGQTIFIGDKLAKEKAGELLNNLNRQYSHFHLLRDIITNMDVPTVGGNIQAGIFRPTKFKTYGIVEYSTFEDDYGMLQVKDSYKFRGLSLDFDDTELRKGNINIKKTFFNPFEHEREEFFNQVFNGIDKHVDKLFNKDDGKKNAL
jgi:hypothetical protein